MARVLDPVIGKLLTLLGYDGTNFLVPRVDSSGHWQTDTLSSALPTGAATEATVDKIWDTDNLTHLQRPSGIYVVSANASAASGTLTVNAAAIAAGYWAVVTHLYTLISAGSSTRVQAGLVSGGVLYESIWKNTPVVLTAYWNICPMVLSPGDNLRATWSAVGAGTTAFIGAQGYLLAVKP